MADVEGVLCAGRVVPRLTPTEARRLLADGTAVGGMHAKLQAALRAIDGGVARVRISDVAAIGDADRGTMIQNFGDFS